MRRSFILVCTLSLFIFSLSVSQSTVILQYFESKYQTIEKRMPDIFMAGYDGLWIPPTNRADTGSYSVGYDLYDRFDLGNGSNPTLYGTEASLHGLIYAAHTTDIKIYPDTIFNHNGFRNKYTAGFGGYPGFALAFPSGADATWGDFHDYSATGDWYTQISGLIDIAQENNDQYIRQPITSDTANNLPGMWVDTTFARFFPDTTASGDIKTFSGFNLTNPLKGNPVKENATGLLLRYARWMNEVIDADGFRLDAAKNMPSWFFSSFFDSAVSGKGRPNRDGSASNPLSFVEVYDGSVSNVGAYTNRPLNRDALDFPLYFPMYTELNANGFGSFKNFIYSSVDAYDDADATNGSMGIQFVEAHDSGISSPKNNNLAYAYILTRPGRPLVYFNAQEFGTNRSFPRTGRGDALGGQYGNQITKLISIHNQYAQGNISERWVDHKFDTNASKFYVYERDNSLLVGLNLQENSGYDEVTVSTKFSPGNVLVELTGNAADTAYNEGGALYQTITVSASSSVPIRIPRSNASRGYVMYGLRNPGGTLSISSVSSTLPAEDTTVWVGIRRITPIPVITGATVTLTLQTDSTEDNALFKLDDGYRSLISGDTSPAGTLILSGNFSGFQQVSSGLYLTATKSIGTTGGQGKYVVNIPTSILSEGMHYFTIVAFLSRPGGAPACFNTFKQVFYVDKTGPNVKLITPTYTGSSDIVTQDANVVVTNPDLTANSMHLFPDYSGPHTVLALSALAADSNHATWNDRTTFTWVWHNITGGTHTLDILAFEQTGNGSVTTYTNINAVIPSPNMQLVYDADPNVNSVNFQSIPSSIGSNEFGDIVVRVDTYKNSSTNYSYANGDFYVDLQIDTTLYIATTYNASFLPPINRLVQNRQYFGDNFDEFRLYWEGYATGSHTITAHAHMNPQVAPANSVSASVTVPSSLLGPTMSILSPVSGSTVSDPRTVSVQVSLDSTAHNLQVFMTDSTGVYNLLGQVNNPSSSPVTINGFLDDPNTPGIEGVQVGNGTYIIRAVASTGVDGAGIATQQEIPLTITNWNTTPAPALSNLPDLKLFINQSLNPAFDLSDFVTSGNPSTYSIANNFLGLASLSNSSVSQSGYGSITSGNNVFQVTNVYGSNTAASKVKYSTYKILKLPKVGLTVGNSWDLNIFNYAINSTSTNIIPPSFGNSGSLILSDPSKVTAVWVGSSTIRITSLTSFSGSVNVDVVASPNTSSPFGTDMDKERIQVYTNLLSNGTFNSAADSTVYGLEIPSGRTGLAGQSWVANHADGAGISASGIWQFNFASASDGIKGTPFSSNFVSMSSSQWYIMRMRVVADNSNSHQSILFGYNNLVGSGIQTDVGANVLFGIPTVWTWQETPVYVHGNSISGYPQFQFKASGSGIVYLDELQIVNSSPTLVDANRGNTRLHYTYGDFNAGSDTTGWGQEIYFGASSTPIISVTNGMLKLDFSNATSGSGQQGIKWTATNGGVGLYTPQVSAGREAGVRMTVTHQSGNFNGLGIILLAAYGVQTNGQQTIGISPSNIIASAGIGVLLDGTYRTVANAFNNYYQFQFGLRSDQPGIIMVDDVDFDRDQDDPNFGDANLFP